MTEHEVKEAIIFSAAHAGYWDDDLSDGVKTGAIKRLYLDAPSLIEALTKKEAKPDEGQMLRRPGWTYDPDIATFRDENGNPVRQEKL